MADASSAGIGLAIATATDKVAGTSPPIPAERALLGSSLRAARAAGKPRNADQGDNGGDKHDQIVKASQWIPLDQQTPVGAAEQVFHIAGTNVYIGTAFGATNAAVFDTLRFGAVVNITSGGGRVPNAFADRGVEYLCYELADFPGVDIRPAFAALDRIDAWNARGVRVLVHCRAGLSRSATVLLAWLMRSGDGGVGATLARAVEVLTAARGRCLQCNPTFWCALAAFERERSGAPAGTPPTHDFAPHWHACFGNMGYPKEMVNKALKAADFVDWGKASAVLFGD